MIRIRDDRGHELVLPDAPQRVVSLVPSDTYTLAAFGGADRLVGRTEYCVEPAAALAHVEVIGGTKNVDVERVMDLRPDLVVANQEENRRVDIERLEAAGAPVLLSFVHTVAEGLDHARRLAALFPDRAGEHAAPLAAATERYEAASRREVEPVPVFVPIWMDPLMTADGRTFISDVVELCGGRNVFADRPRRYPLAADLGRRPALPPEQVGDRDTRYPRVTLAEVAARAPRLVLLPDEPHAFTPADAEVFRGLDMPAARWPETLVFCDGKDLMWYGLRALEGIGRISALVDRARHLSY